MGESYNENCTTPIVSLEKHFNLMLHEVDKRNQLQWEAQDKALQLARTEAEKQYHSLNNLRKEYMEERSLFLLESVYDSRHEALVQRMNDITTRLAEVTNWFKVWGAVILALSTAFQLLSHFIFK